MTRSASLDKVLYHTHVTYAEELHHLHVRDIYPAVPLVCTNTPHKSVSNFCHLNLPFTVCDFAERSYAGDAFLSHSPTCMQCSVLCALLRKSNEL